MEDCPGNRIARLDLLLGLLGVMVDPLDVLDPVSDNHSAVVIDSVADIDLVADGRLAADVDPVTNGNPVADIDLVVDGHPADVDTVANLDPGAAIMLLLPWMVLIPPCCQVLSVLV